MTAYTTLDVPVRGGALRVGQWDSDDLAVGAQPETVVLAIHGITANHREFAILAGLLTGRPGTRVLAPDLRGRGRSSAVSGAAGMAVHADDLVAVLDAAGADRATVVGHSMGGFVAVVLAHRVPERVTSLVLIDGGLPLPVQPAAADGALQATLGPAADRLAMTFGSRQDYLDFWRQHPALGPGWSPAIVDYLDYDLEGEAPALRSSVRLDVIGADVLDMATGADLRVALTRLPEGTVFFRAPAGMFAEPPGLYPPTWLQTLAPILPAVGFVEVEDVNHYTIVLSEPGARRIAEHIRSGRDATAPRG